jgi:hypothetical protein
MCFQPAIGSVGLNILAWVPLPRVIVEAWSSQLSIRRAKWKNIPLVWIRTTWQASYTEIESAQTIVVPWWIKVAQDRGPYSKVSVRLKMGTRRMRVVIITPDIEGLLSLLEGRGVEVTRQPMRLNHLWIGRK